VVEDGEGGAVLELVEIGTLVLEEADDVSDVWDSGLQDRRLLGIELDGEALSDY